MEGKFSDSSQLHECPSNDEGISTTCSSIRTISSSIIVDDFPPSSENIYLDLDSTVGNNDSEHLTDANLPELEYMEQSNIKLNINEASNSSEDGTSDIIGSDVLKIEEWLKCNRSENSINIDIGENERISEININEFNIKASLSNLSTDNLINNWKVSDINNLYSVENISNCADFNLTTLPNYNADYDNSNISLISNINLDCKNTSKKCDTYSSDRIPEDIFFAESVILKRNKIKDFNIDEKGFFDDLLQSEEDCFSNNLYQKKELLVTSEQDNLITLNKNSNIIIKKYTNQEKFGVHLDKNNDSQLLSSQEENTIVTNDPGTSEREIPYEVEQVIADFSYDSNENKNNIEYPVIGNIDIDNKLFNLLPFDASNDILDNDFSENVESDTNQDGKKNEKSRPYNIVAYNKDSAISINQNLLIKKKEDFFKEPYISNNSIHVKYKSENTNEENEINLDNDKNLPKTSTPQLKVIKNIENNNSQQLKSSSLKAKRVGVVQLKIISPCNSKNLEKNFSNAINGHEIPLCETEFPVKELPQSIAEGQNIEIENFPSESSQDSSKIAKISIVIDPKNICTYVAIKSSSQVLTVFKSNTCDMLRVVEGIKEGQLEYLGLKQSQLLETVSMGKMLIDIYAHVLQKKNGSKENQEVLFNLSNCIEINRYVYESSVKQAVKKLHSNIISVRTVGHDKDGCTSNVINQSSVNEGINQKEEVENLKTSDNVGMPLLPRALPTMVSVPSVLDSLSASSTSKIDLTTVLTEEEEEEKDDKNDEREPTNMMTKNDEEVNNGLQQIGISPDSLLPSFDEKGAKAWICPITSCLKHFVKLSSLKIHILNHKGFRPYKCNYENCDWSFYTRFKLKRHLETHLKRRDFECPEPGCNRRFTTIYNLNTHSKIHKVTPSFLCSIVGCEMAFRTKAAAELHLRTHSEATPTYPCKAEGCKKSFFTSHSLASHMRHHNKLVDLVCQWTDCGKKFELPSRLKLHMRKHTGQKPFVCNYEGCNGKFQCASKLGRHQKTHTNDRKFSCPICEKSFLRSEHLKGHLLTHTGVRNFHCPLEDCDAKFTAKSSLYVHLKKHNTRKERKTNARHSCPNDMCDKTFTSKYDLRQHVTMEHFSTQSSEPVQLDYITLLGEKQDSSVIRTTESSSFDMEKQSSTEFIPLTLQYSSSTDVPQVCLESSQATYKPGPSSAGAQIDGNNVLILPEGLFTFSECDSLGASTDLGFLDLPPKETTSKSSSTKTSSSQAGSSARTDYLGNIILSQRAKNRQQSSLMKKGIVTTDFSAISTDADIPSLSLQFQPTILPVDGISGSLYDDLITRDLTTDTQSTINLRDLE